MRHLNLQETIHIQVLEAIWPYHQGQEMLHHRGAILHIPQEFMTALQPVQIMIKIVSFPCLPLSLIHLRPLRLHYRDQ